MVRSLICVRTHVPVRERMCAFVWVEKNRNTDRPNVNKGKHLLVANSDLLIVKVLSDFTV